MRNWAVLDCEGELQLGTVAALLQQTSCGEVDQGRGAGKSLYREEALQGWRIHLWQASQAMYPP
jgi:hypothetical protein